MRGEREEKGWGPSKMQMALKCLEERRRTMS